MKNKIVKFHCYKGTSLTSWIIRLRTVSIYSHIAIEIDGIVYEAWTSNGADGVVKSNSPLTYHKDGTKFDTIEVEMKNKTMFRRFLEQQVGKKYDWRAIWSFAFKWNKANPNKWFCSELADTFFKFEISKYISDGLLVCPEAFRNKILGYSLSYKNKK